MSLLSDIHQLTIEVPKLRADIATLLAELNADVPPEPDQQAAIDALTAKIKAANDPLAQTVSESPS